MLSAPGREGHDRLWQTRQDHPREGSPEHHDAAGHPSKLDVPRPEEPTGDERWKLDYAPARVARRRARGGHQGNAGSAADELLTHRPGPEGIPGVSHDPGGDRESGPAVR